MLILSKIFLFHIYFPRIKLICDGFTIQHMTWLALSLIAYLSAFYIYLNI